MPVNGQSGTGQKTEGSIKVRKIIKAAIKCNRRDFTLGGTKA